MVGLSTPTRIVCWSPFDPERIGDVNVLASGNRDQLQDWADMGGDTSGRWFQARNVSPSDLGTFAWLAKHTLFAASTTTIEGAPAEAMAFFRLAEELVASLQRLDIDGYWATRRVLGDVPPPRHLQRLSLVFDIFDAFIADAVAPTVAGSWCDPSRNDWFLGTTGITSRLAIVDGVLGGLSPDLDPIAVPIRRSVQRIRTEVASWRGHAPASLSFAAACYAYALAEHYARLKRPVAGVLLAHRSLDLFLLSLCFSSGLARLLRDGPDYIAPDPGRERVSLVNSYYHLEKAAVITRDTHRYQWTRELNDVRNLLLFTHGTNGAQDVWLSNAVTRVGDVARDILGNEQLRQTARSILPALPLRPRVFFDVESGLDTYLEEISVQPTGG